MIVPVSAQKIQQLLRLSYKQRIKHGEAAPPLVAILRWSSSYDYDGLVTSLHGYQNFRP